MIKVSNRFLICALCISLVLLALCVGAIIWCNSYNAKTFNCKDMSYTLAPVFHSLGINTSIVYGTPIDYKNLTLSQIEHEIQTNHTVGHCWLSLNGMYFDATTLTFSSEREFHAYFVDTYPYSYRNILIGIPTGKY